MSHIQLLNALEQAVLAHRNVLPTEQAARRPPVRMAPPPGGHRSAYGSCSKTPRSLPSPADSAKLSLPFYAGTVTYLARNGANLKLADERGETALGLALKLGQKDIATP
jgi:hypothetical protein